MPLMVPKPGCRSQIHCCDLGASVAYALDGPEPGEIGSETVSVDRATVRVVGVSAERRVAPPTDRQPAL